ncbi:MAG: bsaAI [Candidatus Eisenbacteria bacterium]|uniref:BsaAI n=1 Tax=Eiseniibacteriota bacterium TaxID=2212470 RepID=A0A933SF17_UNCEI|nr:bsaAI [Candidatus Eisenbacteria bacterium]
MRNLSAFVGEVFAAAMILEHSDLLRKNPHQDGYPDLLVMDAEGAREWARLSGRLREKAPFSPFGPGGFEVKATCGAVPTPAQCIARGFPKPDMGDQRVHCLTAYDWKAHHRETNRLFGLVWDFIDGSPAIVAVFYRSDLQEADWGRIVQPREGGGRTTSVSIMTRDGVRKMYEGWVVLLNSRPYAKFFDERNGGRLLEGALDANGH